MYPQGSWCQPPAFGEPTAMASAAEPAWMVTPYLGYSTQMNFENTDSSTLHSKASNNWGLMVHKEVENQGEIGFIYSYQNSDISLGA